MSPVKNCSTANQVNLILVGTVHHDRNGYAALLKLLAEKTPDIITLEFSPYGRAFRTKNSHRLIKRLSSFLEKSNSAGRYSQPLQLAVQAGNHLPAPIGELLSTIVYPFEYVAAKNYALKHKIPFYCIDLSSISRQKLLLLKREALIKANIQTLLQFSPENLHEKVALCYKKAQALWHAAPHNREPVPGKSFPETDTREAHMSSRIKNFIKKFPKKKVLHIGGWEHIACGIKEQNLYTLLKEFSPQRILLCEQIIQ